MKERGASDLHLSAGHPAQLRVDGEMTSSRTGESLSPETTLQLAYSILTEDHRKRL